VFTFHVGRKGLRRLGMCSRISDLLDKAEWQQFGNNRGNKYSKKCIHHSPTSIPFWNFSMDEFAFHDIPESINYVLATTSASSLSYIGFSQGTAQAFATLAIHPKLNEKLDVFIALAPAMSPAGLSNGVVDALVKASPQVLFLLFGRRSILSSATMWQSILYPPIFVKAIDMGLSFLFGWQAKNISTSQKLAAYPHLYSFTSTKSVVHWFQIIRTKSFQMYDDDVQPPLSIGSVSKYTKVAKFPTRNIKTPIVLVYGGSDSLVDIGVMLKELPSHTIAIEIPHYEHLDFLWARDVDTLVFPHVLDALGSFSNAEHTKEDFARYRAARHESVHKNQPPPVYASEDEKSPTVDTYAAIAGTAPRRRGVHEEDESSSSTSPNVPTNIKTAIATGADATIDDLLPSPVESRLRRTARSGSSGSNVSFDAPSLRGKGISLGVGRPVAGMVSRASVEGLSNLTSSDTDGGAPRAGKNGK
jgi:lysosomal acid lipase/cholesteryl ester hydrolase